MDYRKLAEEFGGRAESQPQEAPSVDYGSIAKQFGGIAEVEPIAPVAEGKSAPAIPQLPIAPVESTVPEDEGFFGRNYRFAKDNLISGFENLRASSKGTSFAISRGAVLRDEEEYGGPGVPLAPPEVRERYERNKQEAGQTAQDIAEFRKKAQERQLASPLRPETARLKAAMGDDVAFMESAKEAGAALLSNPVGVIADLGTESLPAIAYMVSTSLLVRMGVKSPTAAAVAGGTGSAVSQFGNEYVDRLQKGESHDEAWKNAAIRSGVIGTFDAVSLKTAGSAAGKIVEALKTGKPASVAAKEFIKETGKQAGLGGAGEAAGSLAIGEIPNPAAVIAEMAGETVTGPFDAIGTYQRVKGIEKLSKEDKAIADLDKLAADEEVEAATSGLIGEGDLFAEEAATAVSPQKTIPTTTATTISPEETIPATLEELKKIDKDLKKKLGRAPTFEETETALNDFEQNKTKQLQAKSGGREPTVPVLSGEEAVSGVTGAPERVEPTGLGGAVEPTDVSGARKEPTLGAVKPKDQINTAKKMMADISKQPLNVENVSGKIIGDVKKFKGFKIYKEQEGSETFWRAQSPENQALNKIGRGDSSHESLELAKDAVGENLNNKFDAETFAQRLLPKLTEGKATPTAPTRFRTAEDLSPEDKTAFNSGTAEIRASMKEATDAAKERGLPFANAAASFVDQLRALDQSYGIGEPIASATPIEKAAAVDTPPVSKKRTIAQLAAELGGIADEDGGFRPAIDEEGVETIKAKAGVNARRLSKLLGPKLYGDPQEMPFVSVKEMMQNAFDAIKPMQEKGQLQKGKIAIGVDKASRIISVADNGTGMSPETLSTTFLTIAGTKKEGERDSGGLGIAKMQFLFNNEGIRVVTMRDGVASELISSGSQLEESMDNPDINPDIRIYRGDSIPAYVKSMLPEGHGTYVEVVVPGSYKNPSTGEDKPIPIEDYYSDYTVLEKSPLFGDIDVEFNGRTLDIGANFPYDKYTTFANVNFDWGVARIYVAKEKDPYMWRDNVSTLSNGLWQFDRTLKANDKVIKRRIYVDVSPKKSVKPEDPGYPFDLNRQRFSPSVEKSFEQIFNYLKLVYQASDLASDVDDFGTIEYLDVDKGGRIKASTPIKLEPPVSSDIFKASQISEGDQIEIKNGVLYVKGKAIPELTDAELKAATIDVDELTVDPALIDKNRVMVHSNAGVVFADQKKIKDVRNKITALEKEIDNYEYDADRAIYREKYQKLKDDLTKLELGSLTSITQVGREKFGERFDNFLFGIGNQFKRIRDFVSTLDPAYASFPNEAIGVSLDAGYRGVSIKIPFSGVFINPFAPAIPTIPAAAAGTWGTMIHELAHIRARSHDAGFAAEMQKIILLLDASMLDGNPIWPDIQDQITIAFRKHKDIFEYFNKELTDGKLKPLGKRLSNSSEEQIGDARTPERMAGARSATEGESDIPGRSDLRSENIGEERERTRDAGEATTSELEQRIIELSLKGGDIHPTMVSAIANNDLNGALLIASQRLSGFSAELAKKLLDLKLPTNIGFNNERDLVRRSIDDVSAPQQQRLFRYVQMHYPQVYDKYFKNYDRSESLETVAEGLIELQKPNYKLGPVIAEFNTVSSAYKKHIAGLTSPGAYYPRFDEIVLNTNTLSGKSYRVFLHEIVHAATEYTLNTYSTNPQSLTPGQRESVEELTKMYNYALKEVGSAPYGMTNIYEFISEVFTNKKFQELLKGIKYKSDKPTFLSKLIKAIFKAVGFDNLASNAMVEATNIFSAVRSQTTVDRGPRFAKSGPKSPRVKGPISTPQAWRTAESQTTSMIGLFNDALKGRRSWDEVLKIIGPSMWNANTGRFRRAILGVANLRQIDDLTKTKFPQISGAVRIIEQMLAYRGNIMKTAEDITKEWTKAQAKKPKQGQLMGRVMIEATIRGIDPDRPGTKTVNAALVQAWNQLDPEFKQIYRQVRDFYANSVKSMVREMKSKIAKSNRPLSEKKAAIREINDKFGPDKLVQPYFPLRRFGKHWFQVGKGNFKEFYEFESPINRELAMRSRVAELRKGNVQQQALADTIRKGSGLSELFTQNITTTKVLKEAQDIIDNVTATTIGDAKKEMKDSLNQLIYILLPQQSMRKMFINRKAIQGASGDMLRVFATSAVHSAYQQSRFKFAEPFLNNLTNAVEYVEEFSDRDRASVYRDYIQEVEKRAPTILSNEDTSLAAVVAGRASELTFFYMLSAPFSAMLNLLGVAQVTMPYIGGRYGYAKTNALMIKNFGRYFATMPSRTISPLITGSIMQAQFPSIVEGGKLTGILKRAADRFIEEGQINISLTNDLMDMGDRPSALYTGRYNMVKKMLSGLFHQSERLGREVSLLTTFELAYDKLSKSPKKDLRGVIERDAQGNPVMNTPDEAFELAISEAKDIVGLSLGDFTRQMKPRYFVSPLMSVITKFKQYSVLATYAVVRNFYFTVAAPFRKAEIEEFRQQMVKDKISPKVIEQRLAEAEAQRKELYREGRRRLAGILGVTFLLGGNEASPFYSIGIGTLVKMLADEEDDEFFDWENWLKNYMEEELGGAAGDLFAEMGMNPETADDAGRFVGGALQRGLVSELTGGDLASRVSLDPKSLWYREGRYSSDVRESIVEDVIANAGPVVGLGFNWIDSYRLFQEGQYQRAFEKAAPALISKPVAAERIADEGAKTASGIKLADNFSAWEIAMLSIGLQPTRLAQAQKSAIEAKQYTEKIKDRRTTLLTRLWMERDNFAGYTETMETITKFNLKYPNYAISGENIKDSFDRRGKNQAKAGAIGGQFDDKALPDALQMLRYGRN